ncbi:MAG: Fic family protein [Actinomyces urogenitalis]|uniref:Fic family protein n=1 Tax=Actinomyces urogenitalis TaxID=103621 RepID=UPI0029098375|nr:Fic family protein [Actinomyces urogenitalis]MDU6150925.1 Fic family protein [Actinomyces urogenitalis]
MNQPRDRLGRFRAVPAAPPVTSLDAIYGTTPLDADEERYLADPSLVGVTKAEIDRREAAGLTDAYAWVQDTNPDLLDEHTLRTMHRIAFGRVWTWAGTYRTRELSIGIDPSQIGVQMAQLFGSLAWRASQGLLDEGDIARSHLALTSIHPFHNGNGRLARAWATMLARRFDLTPPTWGEREAYIAALRSGDERVVDAHLYPAR